MHVNWRTIYIGLYYFKDLMQIKTLIKMKTFRILKLQGPQIFDSSSIMVQLFFNLEDIFTFYINMSEFNLTVFQEQNSNK